MLTLTEHSFIGECDHQGLVDDNTRLAAAVRAGEIAAVPQAALAELGAHLLHAAPGDFGALPLRWQGEATLSLGDLPGWLAFGGLVQVPALLAAAIAGRKDLQERFKDRGRFVPEAGLRWLVLHGINEHRLWHGLTAGFVRSLLSAPVPTPLGPVPPLGLLLMAERLDLRQRFVVDKRWSTHAFDTWLEEFAIRDYGLFWCLDTARVSQWNGAGWNRNESHMHAFASTPPAAMEPMRARFVSEPINRVRARRREWSQAGRLYPVHEFAAHDCIVRLVDKGLLAASDQWLTFAGSAVSLLSPRLDKRSGFIAIEIRRTHADQGEAHWAIAINGQDLLCQQWIGQQTQLLVGWVPGNFRSPGAADCDVIDLVDVQNASSNACKTEILRIWNF